MNGWPQGHYEKREVISTAGDIISSTDGAAPQPVLNGREERLGGKAQHHLILTVLLVLKMHLVCAESAYTPKCTSLLQEV